MRETTTVKVVTRWGVHEVQLPGADWELLPQDNLENVFTFIEEENN